MVVQVVGQILHFEEVLGEQSRLTAQWQLIDVKNQRELMRKPSQFQPAVEASDNRAMAAALSLGLGSLSQDIAGALRTLTRQPAAR